jgi:hypothetical protein
VRKIALVVGFLISLMVAPAAFATPPTDALGGDLDCGVVTDDGSGGGEVTTSLGQTWCGTIRASDNTNAVTTPVLPTVRSTHKSWDNTPLDVNVALPDEATFGAGPYPVVGVFHGYGGSKSSFKSLQRWLDQGYAAYSITQRGFGESCNSAGSQAADVAGCANGYVRLIDPRYEVRDTQIFLGELVDEGLILPTKIASTGGSYGGGMSMALAALKDRMMMPNGSLVDWQSPGGTPMSLAVATPNVPWTELTYALAPNGSNIDYIEDASYYGRTGVMKESYIQGLAASGRNAPVGTDPTADIVGWKALLDAGENYDDDPAVTAMKTEINTFHSSYGFDHSEAPAPLLISSGFTDDLFPVNEATRFYNRTRAQYPNAPLSLFFGSFGHARGQSQSNVGSALRTLEDTWIAHYIDGVGTAPDSEVTTYTQTCPNGDPGAGPFVAPDWASIAPGEIRLQDSGGAQTVEPSGGDLAVGASFNPLTSSNPCTSVAGAKEPGTANYELTPAPVGGYTVMGSTTVVAKISLPGTNSQIAARLVDVSPDGTTKTLVSRGLWRPENSGFQVFQLFANGWEVEEDHVLRLELLPRDSASTTPGGFLSNYGRPSNGQEQATISKVDLRVPVLETPGSLGGLVDAPAPKVLPDRPGVELAPGYGGIGSIAIDDYALQIEPPCPEGTIGTTPPDCRPLVIGDLEVNGKPTVEGKTLTAEIGCSDVNDSCEVATIALRGAPKAKNERGKNALLARGKDLEVEAGVIDEIELKLSDRARNLFRDKKSRKGLEKLRTEIVVNGESSAFTTTKRVGKVK